MKEPNEAKKGEGYENNTTATGAVVCTLNI
jgi:hypothetical protein